MSKLKVSTFMGSLKRFKWVASDRRKSGFTWRRPLSLFDSQRKI